MTQKFAFIGVVALLGALLATRAGGFSVKPVAELFEVQPIGHENVLHSCDVIMADLTGPANWNTVTGPTNGIVRYSIGTLACNIGLEPLDWYANSPDHPMMPQNLYRLKNGRFEQIGLGWMKHAFAALQQTFCGPCTPACGGGTCSELGIGCSDPYTASRNGGPSSLGPRSQVNAATGQTLVWPHAVPASLSQNSNNNGQIHVAVDDVNPALNPGALFFGEALYLVREETEGGNDDNNSSYRQCTVSDSNGFPLTFIGQTQRTLPAIYAWQANDPQVRLQIIDIDFDGRMILGTRVTDNGNGTWHYEYAVFNLNSDRSGGSFIVPVPECTTITNIGFHDVSYHSGEPYDGTDWTATRADGAITWNTQTYDANVNANAIRWMTMYNFRFDADAPPLDQSVKIGLFKPGTPESMDVLSQVPGGMSPSICPADCFPLGGNGVVDIDDLVTVITSWGATSGAGDVYPSCGDHQVNIDDLVLVIARWGNCH